MKTIFTLSAVVLSFFATGQTMVDTSGGRYWNEIFPSLTITTNVVYGSAVTFNQITDSLTLDIYEPVGDTVQQRPLIVFAHGGSFIFGTKTDPDMVQLCTRFAKMGYVCASINYRLGTGFPIDSVSAGRAMLRATQDMKAAVRFFRQNFAFGNSYRIHPDYIFAGGAWGAMATLILALNFLRSNGYLQKVVSAEHYHLMGKLLLTFTIFWAYIAFSQFFLIWYANITEETRLYLLRNTGGWNIVSYVLLFGHFAASFVLLLSAGRKKKTGEMNWVCGWVLLMHCVDWYWLVIPERGPSLTHGASLWIDGAWLGDVVAFLTIGGLVSWAFLRRLAKASLYPCRDPRLLESVLCSN